MLAKFKDNPGAAYTEALAVSIPKLKDMGKTKAQAALVARLGNVPLKRLEEAYLKSEHAELRRAAALAAGAKKAKGTVAELINLLEDAEAPVAQAAHQALVQITGQDYGPEDNASLADRTKAAKTWRDWHKKQQK